MSHKHRLLSLGKLMAYILRHRPDEFGLVPDEEGFISLKELQQAINEEEGWGFVRRSHILEVVWTDDRKRFEIKDDKIRATYGHSLEEPITYEPVMPPKVLYHGTRRKSYPGILQRGLLPMGRQYVHLTPSRELAERMGKRRDPKPLILEVMAQRAYEAGIRFFHPAPLIYLTDRVPPEFLSGPPVEKVTGPKERPPEALREPGPLFLDLKKEEVRRGKAWKREARRFRKRYRNL